MTVIQSDSQLHCEHNIGVTTKGNVAFLMSLCNYEIEFKESGGVKFDFCPWCGTPVSQILGEEDTE